MSRIVLTLFLVFSATPALFSQLDTSETVVELHRPSGKLLNFRTGDYIISLPEAAFLTEDFARFDSTKFVLFVADTMNFATTRIAMYQLTKRWDSHLFVQTFAKCLADGEATIHCLSTHEEMRQLKVRHYNSACVWFEWWFNNPNSNKEVMHLQIGYAYEPCF